VASEKPKKVAVLMGGRSSEREISIKTGKQISQALTGEGYEVKEIDPAGALVKDLQDFSARCGLYCTARQIRRRRDYSRAFRAARIPLYQDLVCFPVLYAWIR